MANVVINGVTYSDVPQVDIPKAGGGGDATFYSTEGDTGVAADVLAGKTVHTADGAVTGSMPNNGSVSGTISTVAGTVSVPAGYASGGVIEIAQAEQAKIVSGNIKSGVTMLGVSGKNSVVDTEISADAASAATILSGKKAFVNGSEITGTMTAATVSQDSTTKVLSIS